MEVTDDSGAKVAMSSSVDMEGRVPGGHELTGDVAGVFDADAEDDGLFSSGESLVVVKGISGDSGFVKSRSKLFLYEIAATSLETAEVGLFRCIDSYRRECAKVDEFGCSRPEDEVIEHIPQPLA
jgi:hypothetical protein